MLVYMISFKVKDKKLLLRMNKNSKNKATVSVHFMLNYYEHYILELLSISCIKIWFAIISI